MAKTFPSQRQHQTPWYVPYLLPQGQLVLLDGDPKVGKTLITAGMGAFLSIFPEMDHPGSILYANTSEQQKILIDQLLDQEKGVDLYRHLDLDELPHEGNLLEILIPWLESELKQNDTRFLFLDGHFTMTDGLGGGEEVFVIDDFTSAGWRDWFECYEDWQKTRGSE